MTLLVRTSALAALVAMAVGAQSPAYAAGYGRIGTADHALATELAGHEIPTPQLGHLRGGTVGWVALPPEITSSTILSGGASAQLLAAKATLESLAGGLSNITDGGNGGIAGLIGSAGAGGARSLNLGNGNLGNGNLGDGNLGSFNSGPTNTGFFNSGNANTGFGN